MTTFEANGRTYTTPGAPVVVVCVDGSDPAYHRAAVAAGRMPWLAATLERGTSWPAHCAMPALTNPNNVSIATGQPPAVHGISGNYLLDPDTGAEVLMNDPAYLRVPTLFARGERSGLDVAVVTAKDKLRRLLGAGLERGTCVSSETAPDAPDVYSAALSEHVLATGVRLLETRRPDLTFLSLTDYVQHKHAPGTPTADGFYAMLDSYAARLDALGVVLVITADHGMSAKPHVLHLEPVLPDGCRVVLPITDPYTVHHGALGSFASVHLPAGADRAPVVTALAALPGVEQVLARDDAARRYSLPVDRIGDVVVLAQADTALGRSPEAHDLSGLDAPLRSHGALGERDVPFIVNRRLERPLGLERVHNYDAFWVATTLVSRQRDDLAS